MNALRDENEVKRMKEVITETIYKLAKYAFMACVYYDQHPYDEKEVFGEGPSVPDDVFERLRSSVSS